jgi:trimethylamine--corrinoid protein Co-methyltransferase
MAVTRKKEILEGYFPRHIPDDVDRAIRQRFDVRLPQKR